MTSPASVAELGFVRRSSSLLWFRGQVCSRSLRGQRLFLFAPWSRFAYRGRRPLRSAFPAGIARHSPGWTDAGSRSPDSEFHAPNNALQRTEAGGRLFSVYRVSSRQPLSLSLSPLGALSLCFVFGGTSVPIRFGGSVCSRSLRGRGLLSGVVASFGQPFQPAVPVIPPAGSTPVPIPPALRSHTPNHALQRTEAGGRLFFAIHVLLRQPPSLSLSSLGPESLPQCSSRARWFPFLPRHVSSRSLSCGTPVPVLLPARPSFGHVASPVYPFPAAVPVVPPPESTSVLSGVPEALCRRVA